MMSTQAFLNNFGTIIEAPGGLPRLRDLVLELAVRGRLVEQDHSEESASTGLKEAQSEKTETLANIRSGGSLSRVPTSEEGVGDSPHGWGWARIDDTGEYVNGLSFKNSDWKPAGTPIIRIQNLTNPGIPFNYADGPFPENRIAYDGDILVSWSATLNAFRWNRGTGVVNQHIFKVIPDERVVAPDFLFHLLRHTIRAMAKSEAAHGLAMKHINRGPFLSYVVAIPPLAEQERIVARLEELLDRCDQLEAGQERSRFASNRFRGSALRTLTEAETPDDLRCAWERVSKNWPAITNGQDSISNLEASILGMAMRGHLTKSMRPKESRYHDALASDLPQTWESKQLQDLVDPQRSISYGVIKLGPDPGLGGVPILRCSDVRRLGIDRRNIRHIDHKLSVEYSRTILRGGEHLVNVRGTLGGCAIVPPEMAGYNIAREVAVVPTTGIDVHFLLYVLASPDFLKYTAGSLRGTAYQGLNLSLLRTFRVPIPPLAEQKAIAERVGELLKMCRALEAALRLERDAADHLSESLCRHVR